MTPECNNNFRKNQYYKLQTELLSDTNAEIRETLCDVYTVYTLLTIDRESTRAKYKITDHARRNGINSARLLDREKGK